MVGDIVGAIDGDLVGPALGAVVGALEGAIVGASVGGCVGAALGERVGAIDGGCRATECEKNKSDFQFTGMKMRNGRDDGCNPGHKPAWARRSGSSLVPLSAAAWARQSAAGWN